MLTALVSIVTAFVASISHPFHCHTVMLPFNKNAIFHNIFIVQA